MNKTVSLGSIFFTFFKTGLILLGGGYVILPILQAEIVENKNWLTSDELIDYYAISQSLPGLIAINISIFSGYKIRGKIGAVTAVMGLVFPAFWIIVLLASILTKAACNPLLQGAFRGAETGVIVLIISAVGEMWHNAIKDNAALVIYFIVLTITLLCEIPPLYIIIVSIFAGIIYKSILRRKGKNG